jgi:hypothetical protein
LLVQIKIETFLSFCCFKGGQGEMKFNKIGAGILGLSMLFCGVVFGADSNITIKDEVTNRTFNRDVVIYNGYVENNSAFAFSGSTTTSGGSNNFVDGSIYTQDLINNKDFAFTFTPGAAGGSVTAHIYGVFGTTSVGNGTTSAGVVLLNSASYAGVGTASTSVVTITTHPTKVAVGISVTGGTVTVSCGMSSTTAR